MGFHVDLSLKDGSCAVYPCISANLLLAHQLDVKDPTIGALCYWRSAMDPSGGAGLASDQLIERLSSGDAGVRSIARKSLDMMRRATPDSDNLTQQAPPGEKRVWTAVALVRRFVRMERPDGGYQFIVNPLKEALSSGLLDDKPALKVVAAMELARVRQDTSYLETVARIPLSAADVASVKQDMLRNLHYFESLENEDEGLEPGLARFFQGGHCGDGGNRVFQLALMRASAARTWHAREYCQRLRLRAIGSAGLQIVECRTDGTDGKNGRDGTRRILIQPPSSERTPLPGSLPTSWGEGFWGSRLLVSRCALPRLAVSLELTWAGEG